MHNGRKREGRLSPSWEHRDIKRRSPEGRDHRERTCHCGDYAGRFLDYGGCLYPQGIVGDQIMYFNHKDIAKVVFEGYTDDDDKMMVDNINEWYRNSDFDRVDVTEWNKRRRGESGDVK